ncbi:Hypothetical protein mma_1786 [Janthinobacterium sp. Marseille]|nr:hypothetical protein [Janthinobacterium sp. Marseille]ABR91267.1 Hypothetical protein mma_1786 [Janthinobacterium sp. Marseille]
MNIRKAIILAASSACCASALAQIQEIKSSNNQIGFQGISSYVDYKETNDGRFGTTVGTLNTEKGWVPGFAVSASAMQDWLFGNDYLQFQYSRNKGHTDYTGSLLTGGAFGSAVQQNDATLIDYSLRWGKGFSVNQAMMLTPYLELGRHEWKRGVNQGETYTNNYYGIGALAQYSPMPRLVLSANALIGRTSGADISVGGPLGFNGSLGNSNLYKVGLSADYAFSQRFRGNVGLNYSAFKYGASANYPVGGTVTWEPDSRTRYTTISAGVGYAF